MFDPRLTPTHLAAQIPNPHRPPRSNTTYFFRGANWLALEYARPVEPAELNNTAWSQALIDARALFGSFWVGLVTVSIISGAASGLIVPAEGSSFQERLVVGAINSAIALVVISIGVMVYSLLRAPYRQLSSARQKIPDLEAKIDKLLAVPALDLFEIRIPKPPRPGHIGNYPAVHFENVLATDLSGEGRILRFALVLSGHDFYDFGEFQAVYQESPEIHSSYLSNPLDLNGNEQGALAFISRAQPISDVRSWEVRVTDVTSGALLIIDDIGEHRCTDREIREESSESDASD